MAELDVDIVAVEREIWSGKATFLFTRTTSGEIGILPHHIPLVAQLVDDAMVRVEREGEDDLRVAVDGGFMSVTEEGVIVLAESAELESEIDADAAKRDSESDDEASIVGYGRGIMVDGQAFDTEGDCAVAIKTPRARDCDNPDATRRLLTEAVLAGRVSHPNVVRVRDVGVHRDAHSPPGVTWHEDDVGRSPTRSRY